MVSCKHCSTQNSLDSTFCKRCGTSLNEEALQEAQAKLDHLVEEGNSMFNQGRIEEAMAVADSAVTSNPSLANAWALKVLCHERKGEIAEALECAEKIVELNPDSELDKIRRNALRTRLQADLRVPETVDRRWALAGALSSVILVGCLGVVIARATSKPTDNMVSSRDSERFSQVESRGAAEQTPQLQTNPVQNPGPTTNGTNPNPAQTQANPQANLGGSSQPNVAAGDVGPIRQPSAGNRNTAPRNSGLVLPRDPLGQLPPPDFDRGTENPDLGTSDLQVRPINPEVRRPDETRRTDTRQDDPSTLRTDPKSDPAQAQTKPEEDPMRGIEIEVSPRTEPRVPRGSESVPSSPNGLATMQRVASEQFVLGNYSAAAKSYEQALQSGGDQIVINQRLGQAYSRLGRNSEAAEAYRRCIAACDAAIAAGKGNRGRHESVKATAEAALKVVGG